MDGVIHLNYVIIITISLLATSNHNVDRIQMTSFSYAYTA